MTEQDMPARRRRRPASNQSPPPRWPGDPERGGGIDVDVEAIAHVLANTCRWGGRTQRFLSLAQHALTMSEEIEALEGIGDEDRRALALHALLVPARAAWLGDEEGDVPAHRPERRHAPRRTALLSTGRCARPQDSIRSRLKTGARCSASSPS